jgi:hypothetical protein
LPGQTLARRKALAPATTLVVEGVVGDALQAAVVEPYIEGTGRGTEIARQELQDALPQRRQRRLTDDRFRQLILAGAEPALSLKIIGVLGLLIEQPGVGRGKPHEFAATKEGHDARQQQADDEEGRHEHHRHAAGRRGTLGAHLLFVGDEVGVVAADAVDAILALAIAQGGLEIPPGAARLDHLAGVLAPLSVYRFDPLQSADLHGAVADQILQLIQLRLDIGQGALIGLQERGIAAQQIAAHPGFQIDHQAEVGVGLADDTVGVLDPLGDLQQVIDDGDEEDRAEDTDAQRQGKIALEDLAEVLLIEGRLAIHGV